MSSPSWRQPARPQIPRWLIIRALVSSFSLTGCVSATSYEQALSVAEVEREGHRRAYDQIQEMKEKLATAEQERDALEKQAAELKSQLNSEENQLAQAQLDVQNREKESEHQALLVTQLRGELARVGEHLKTYAGDKDALTVRLEELELQLKERDQRIALLQAQLGGLKNTLQSNDESSQAAQEQLKGAMNELSRLQEALGEKEPDEEAPNEETPNENEASASPKEETRQDESEESPGDPSQGGRPREDESIYEPAEEILPAEESGE